MAISENVQLALIVAIPPLFIALFTAPFMAWQQNRYSRLEKQEDYARQDAVAAQAAKAAELLLASNQRVAERARISDEKLDEIKVGQKEIHVLVNSNLTAAKQSQLVALEAMLVAQRALASMKEAGGHITDAKTLADMETTSTKISELRAELSDRLTQTEVAERQT